MVDFPKPAGKNKSYQVTRQDKSKQHSTDKAWLQNKGADEQKTVNNCVHNNQYEYFLELVLYFKNALFLSTLARRKAYLEKHVRYIECN